MIIFSVDPGLTGAWAVIADGTPLIVGDMPVSGEGSRKRVSANVLAGFMRSAAPDLVVIEYVGPIQQAGPQQAFRLGMAFSAALSVANVLEIPFELVTPPVWKRAMGLIKQPKEASRQKALDLAPRLTDSLQLKKHDGRGEAILIGLYAAATWDVRPAVAA